MMLLSVGELSERKNHEVVIKALAEIKQQNIKYFIAGRGDLKDHLSDLIINSGLQDEVKLLGFRSDVNMLTKAADLFIFPSIQEGLPVALMEAMSTGLPVVASQIRGNVDLIQEEKNGVLFDCNDVITCKKGICDMLSNPQNSYQMGENNITDVKAYSEKRVMSLLRAIYAR